MSNLQSAIENAANAFAKEIIAAVSGSTLRELLDMQGGAPTASTKRRGRPPGSKPGRKPGRPLKAEVAKRKPGRPLKAEAAKRKPGRPPKAKPGLKPGRPPKATAKKITKKAAKTAANQKRSINYPKCSVPGCGKNRYAKGNGMCGEHFRASKAG